LQNDGHLLAISEQETAMAMAEKGDVGGIGGFFFFFFPENLFHLVPRYLPTDLPTYSSTHVFMDERYLLKHPSSSTVFIHNDKFLTTYPI
jgi:hypothetical protein